MATVFEHLSEKYDLNRVHIGYGEVLRELEEDNSPCFTRRADCPARGFDVKDMVPYLRACARQTIGVVMLSTTEEEPLHKEWLQAAKEVKAQITPGRSTEHGGYKVWLITLTGTKRG